MPLLSHSLQVIRTKGENKARGFGFVSFLDPMDCAKAIREMNGKYLGSR
jgi:RNA recognition motif-containing protein